MNTYVPIFRGLDASGGRILRTHTHTERHTHTHTQRHTHTHTHTHIYTHTHTQKAQKSKVFHCRLTVTQSGIARMPCTKWAHEPVQRNLLEPGLGTRRWTDRTSSARGVGTQSPTWATADIRELPVTLPPQE